MVVGRRFLTMIDFNFCKYLALGVLPAVALRLLLPLYFFGLRWTDFTQGVECGQFHKDGAVRKVRRGFGPGFAPICHIRKEAVNTALLLTSRFHREQKSDFDRVAAGNFPQCKHRIRTVLSSQFLVLSSQLSEDTEIYKRPLMELVSLWQLLRRRSKAGSSLRSE